VALRMLVLTTSVYRQFQLLELCSSEALEWVLQVGLKDAEPSR